MTELLHAMSSIKPVLCFLVTMFLLAGYGTSCKDKHIGRIKLQRIL